MEFDPKYHEAEEAFRQRVAPLHDKERSLQERIRQDVSLSDEERQDQYIAGYKQLEEEFEQHANKHGRAFSDDLKALDEKIDSGTGDQFSQHLTSLASVPDEKLSELLAVAERTGQKDLSRAIGQTALERNQFGIFDRWADSDPETAAALKRRRALPPYERFLTRTLAMRPFKADPVALRPTVEDERKAAEAEAAKNLPRQQFFGPTVRRRVGGRLS